MNIFQKIFKSATIPTSYVYNYNSTKALATRTDVLDFYTSWVYGCIDKRASSIARTPFVLYQKVGNKVKEVEAHESLELLQRVNTTMTSFDFMSLTVVYLDLYGVAPWYVVKENNKPNQLYILDPRFFKAKTNKQGIITSYEYQAGTYSRTFATDEIVYLRNINPADQTKGLGVIESARQTVINDDYINQSNNNLLRNGARPSGVIEADGAIEPGVAKKLKKQFKSRYQGMGNTGDVMVFGNGAKFKALSIPPKDLDYIASKGMNRDFIFSMFGVSKPIMGIFEDVNLASAKTAEYLFAKYTLEPLMTKYSSQINEFLIPMFKGGENLWLDFDPIAKEDEELELKKREVSWNKWKTTNEIREEEGMAPVNGGDYIYIPLSMMPTVGGKQEVIKMEAVKSGMSKKHKNVLKKINNRNFKIDKIAEEVSKKVIKGLKPQKYKLKLKATAQKKKSNLSPEQIDAFYKSRIIEETEMEKVWKKAFVEFFEKQRDRFVEAVETGQKAVIENYGIDVANELSVTIQIVEPLMYESLMVGTRQASELIGETTVVDLDYLKDWLDTAKVEVATSITNTTVTKFSKIIEDGANEGLSNAKISQQIKDIFDKTTDARADMIARTETARAVVEAHRKTYEHYGFDDVEWLLEPGACEICQEKSTQKWNIKTIQGQIPGQTHPNCKCDFVPL